MADGRKITTKRARPRLGHSPQARWAKKKQDEGNCRACGKDRRSPREVEAGVPIGQGKLKQLCPECQKKVNDYMKKYRAQKKAVNALNEHIEQVIAEEDANVGGRNIQSEHTVESSVV